MNHYDGTTSLAKAIADDLKLCSLNNTNKIAKLTQTASQALGLPIDTTGGKKSTADCLAIYDWLKSNAVKDTTSDDLAIESAQPADDLFGIGAAPETATPSNQIENMPIGINAISILPDMTEIEAQAKHAELKSVHSIARTMLLEMRDRKGWRALGYSSFSEYGEKEWGYTQSYISRLTTTAARIQTVIMPIGINEIPESQTRELGKLPNDDAIREVYAKVAADNEVITAAAICAEGDKWRRENEKLQNELLAAKQAAEELRNNQTQIIEAKLSAVVATERADLVVENSAAMQALQKQLSDANDKIARDKKELDKAIADGVNRELNKLDTEVSQKRYQFERIEREFNELQKAKSELDEDVGVIAIHKSSINQIKSDLTSLGLKFSDAFDTNVIPVEVAGEWDAIRTAIKKIDAEMDSFFDNHAVIDGAVLVGELVDI